MNNQVTLSQLIQHLQAQLDEHGDVGVYFSPDSKEVWELTSHDLKDVTLKKIFTLTDATEECVPLEAKEKYMRHRDTTKPITKGLVF